MFPRPEPVSPLFSLAELIALRGAARRLELGAQRLARASQAGGYRSIYRGRGLEFDEVRPYQPGDEARDMDWRVTARRGRPHTKLYREERERPVLLLADLGPTMLFGSRHLKSTRAAHCVALLAWAAVQGGDRVGGVVTAAAGSGICPPRPRTDAVLALLHRLVEAQPRAPQPLVPGLLDQGLARLEQISRPGSLLPIVSDFQLLDDSAERRLGRLSRHNDLLMIQVYDPLEAEPPPAGRYRLGIPGQLLELDSRSAALAWRQQFADRQEQLAQIARRLRCPLIPLSTDETVARVLARDMGRYGSAA
ncbi:DUF58 domain-containing protein [Sedimenticola thiotaurini]|uniref:DUF58 domain-containing protein n=1 Tax=Sedimenticola thiotaurini TaxID=1543721 RepID=A0A0F7K2M6_9GAMM|nr:DUF58 domain-containing protein [Sedimenticola thiotaurini]AKH21465.1 hypothetical protein AAY24_15145 [Sedimenticola thiotaurini]